jgi:hypothetical protein
LLFDVFLSSTCRGCCQEQSGAGFKVGSHVVNRHPERILGDAWHGKSLSALRAHQISTLTGAVLLGIYIGAVTRRRELPSSGQALSVGLIWLVMTFCLELLCGHHIAEHPWSQLPFQDYNIFAGDVWALLLV